MNKRVIAGVIDYLILCVIQAILMFLFVILPLINNTAESDISEIIKTNMVITLCTLCFFIFRDILGKKSIGKRIMKLKIINKNDGKETVLSKRILRNITWVIMPIEIIIILINKERLGDMIVGTTVSEL